MSWSLSSFAVFGALACSAVGAAAPAQARPGLNDTGMLQCIADNGRFSRDCAGSGQDAEFGRDISHPVNRDGRRGFSFVKVCHSGEVAGTGACSPAAVLGSGPNDWGCTRDKVTGLTWEVKTNDGGDRDAALDYTHTPDRLPTDVSEFVARVNARGLCGANDWRLPATLELQSLVAYSASAQGTGVAIDTAWFPHQRTVPHWAAEYLGYDPRNAWMVDFLTGGVGFQGLTSTWAAMLVRGGSSASGTRFVPNGAEVTDLATGLIWQRCPVGQVFSGNSCTGTAAFMDWAGALAAARDAASSTGQAWRLPNVKELGSLVDRRLWAPSVDRMAFPWATSYGLWSGTPAADYAVNAWIGDTLYGTAYHFDRSYAFNASLLVRSAR